jgi:protein involved in polysaccharide export with SLBB domain
MRGGQSQTVSLTPPDPAATEVPQTLVEPGDILYLLAGTQISVLGDVPNPGVYALPRTACDPWRALHAAGGPKPGAALNRVILQRATLPAPVVLDLSRPDAPLPEEARILQQGDSLRIPERQVVLLGGVSQAGPLTLESGENVLDVIMRAGVSDPKKLNDVTIIRAEDVRAGRQKTEHHDLTPYIKKGDTSVLVPVHDGDVVYVPTPAQKGPFNLLNLLFMGRAIFGYP